MITAEIKPEELAQGYEGRLLHLNPEHSRRSLREAIAKHAGLSHDKPPIFYLAAAAKVDVSAFVRGHTNIPVLRITVPKPQNQPDCDHGDPSQLAVLRRFGMQKTGAARFCRECVKEDLGFHHVSYWRRTHQIAGVDWCPKHGLPLTETQDRAAYDTPPSNHLDAADDLQVGALQEWPTMQRYVSIVEHALDLRRPLCETDLRNALRTRTKALGLRMRSLCDKLEVSDLVRASLPIGWVKRHLPVLAERTLDEHVYLLDGSVHCGSGATHLGYILAAALIYPSAEDALQVLADPESLREMSLRQRRVRTTRRGAALQEAVVRLILRSRCAQAGEAVQSCSDHLDVSTPIAEGANARGEDQPSAREHAPTAGR